MSETYNASNITVLEGLEPVRTRPAMYIGSTDTRGLHHLVYEVVDNSVDESLAGFCSLIQVTINPDGSCTVEDNGRGIPVDVMPQYGKSALEIVLTVLHAGGKFDKSTYQVSGGLHGVGVHVVNALSSAFSVNVYRDGKVHEMQFERGLVTKPLSVREETLADLERRYRDRYGATALAMVATTGPKNLQSTDVPDGIAAENGAEASPNGPMDAAAFLAAAPLRLTGTKITFTPDAAIFDTTRFDYDVLAHRMRELAFLNSGLEIRIKDERSGDADTFCFSGGIGEFV